MTARLRLALATVPMVAMGLAGALAAQQEDPAGAAGRVSLLHETGVRCPLTLHPVRVLGRPSPQVAEALGLVLENQGMPDLEVAGAAFEVADGTKWEAIPALFGEHVAKAAPTTGPARHHLYAEFLGTPRSGPEEVRFVVADGKGQIVFVDRQVPADADFQRTAGRDPDPLGCASLVAERLFALADWKKAPGSVREGKFAKGWRERSGVPDKKELAAMGQRVKALRTGLAQARIAVLPTLANGGHDADSAGRLAAALAKALGCAAIPAAAGPKVAVAPSSNEQKRLWDLARGLRKALAEAPVAAADYTLVADVGVDEAGRHAYLHVALCTAAGEFVVVDFQNDQSPALQGDMPKTLEDGERLLVARLAALLR